MKTLEASAFLDYEQDRKQPEKYQIPIDCYIDWYKKGAKEAQRWIPTIEELPEHRLVVLANVPMINYPLLFCYDQIKSKWFQLDEGDFYESKITPTNWRPIERS